MNLKTLYRCFLYLVLILPGIKRVSLCLAEIVFPVFRQLVDEVLSHKRNHLDSLNISTEDDRALFPSAK